MITSHIVPFHPVVIQVVKECQAGFSCVVDAKLCIVRLVFFQMTRVAPWLVVPTVIDLVGWGDLLVRPSPEPSLYTDRLQVGPVAAVEVAKPARCPGIREVARIEPVLNVVVFLLGLQRNQVHTIFPAEVAAIQPVIFDFLIGSDIATIKVVVALILEPLWSCRALPRNWGGEQFAFAGLLACFTLS